ncbi:MAG: dihydroorotate dehydrogenase B catalytic subunit [Nitrospinae bacterium RIFCSPLOWO2_12_39_16]|nr:MAG: dihydroorotate dehydrogenase B catalytic subunit [Nitrospinae bacterium RIFCSPLOWO2_02_39_17]OGW11213.1 MAG: dihydroorotate dehydrogenase B catalytic subunit [Nitrospinae bacterium RIFCSPLOWO2_12_39_16]
MVASGTFGYGEEYAKYIDLNKLGAIVVKGLSITSREGNPPPRIVETSAGMLNSIGLQNIGIDSFIKEKLPFLKKFNTKVIVNFFGDSIDEYCEVAKRVDSVSGIHGLEMNISCPNKKEGWLEFGTNPDLAFRVVSAVRKNTKLPLIVKLSPNVTDITVIAKAVSDAGADAVSLINTLSGMAIDIKTRRPKLANIIGGLSGPAIKPVALKMVWQAAKTVKLPIIGIGGIMTHEDAVEFMIAGASAVQVGTANFIEPTSSEKIIDGLKLYCRQNCIRNINKIVGSLNF